MLSFLRLIYRYLKHTAIFKPSIRLTERERESLLAQQKQCREPEGLMPINAGAHCNKKLSYCWETVRRESMPRIAEMDVEMTT